MAVDEAILERYACSSSPLAPSLRLYAWDPPALSLGRTQSTPATGSRRFLQREGIDLVRRPSGGRAVLHEHERTYCLVGQLRREPFAGGVVDTYGRVAKALRLALEWLGLDARSRRPAGAAAPAAGPRPACFDATSVHEISLGGGKAIGSAQLRRRGAFLQHGSILLSANPARLAQALGASVEPGRLGGLEQALGRPLELARLDRAIVSGFERAFDAELRDGELTREEELAATRLHCWKYCLSSWTIEGRIGERERRWSPGSGLAIQPQPPKLAREHAASNGRPDPVQ